MALALQTPRTLAEVRSPSSSTSLGLDHHIVVSSVFRTETTPRHRDAHLYGYEGLTPVSSPLSPEESEEDMPLSPIVFKKNEMYERSRLSYVPPMPPRSASTPPSPTNIQDLPPISPVVFSQQNSSSPSINLQPPPAFPTAGTQSLAVRLKRPLPPLPRNAIAVEDDETESLSRHSPLSALSTSSRPSPSSSYDRDTDSVSSFSPGPFSSRSSATSVLRSASSDSIGSSRAVEAFPTPEARPKVSPLTIPLRSHTSPLPPGLVPPIGSRIMSPYISVTPASPLPPQQFFFEQPPRQRNMSASSLVHSSTAESPEGPRHIARSPSPVTLPRTSSPVPSLTASTSSQKSDGKGGLFTLRRIRSGARLFGRRTLSSASEQWEDLNDDETIVGHGQQGSLSLDDGMLRPRVQSRPDTPSTLGSEGSGGGKRSMDTHSVTWLQDRHPTKRLEIMELVLREEGEVWMPIDIDDAIPKLRKLKVAGAFKT
ncbi:hypothetical protein BD309DRAFT_412202 [Dichomitus squalens]|uniref:Uncharacterized protein n=1 Tax=Dichomitus squalens TaxID=114155 RepID=A0A4Q9P4W6_9APHY|nr:hypothetical protein BD309DRAFT_412202 [Dichomitus squalens]TBU56420.1 hypothetical protein BD310DRAFT_611842 [Dichomitus squalens]